MKRLIVVLFVLVMVCTALPAKKSAGMISFGYTADTRKNSSGNIYVYAGPNLGISTIRTNDGTTQAGFYNHLTMTLVTQMLTSDHEWVNMDLTNRIYVLIHELAGIGVIIPVVSGFDVILGAGISYDLDMFSFSEVFWMRAVFGIGIGADFRFRLGETFGISLGAQTSYSIWGEELYFSSDYSDSFRIDFSKVSRFSGVKAKLGLGFCF